MQRLNKGAFPRFKNEILKILSVFYSNLMNNILRLHLQIAYTTVSTKHSNIQMHILK
jgi:hypothetical protein